MQTAEYLYTISGSGLRLLNIKHTQSGPSPGPSRNRSPRQQATLINVEIGTTMSHFYVGSGHIDRAN